FERRTFECLEVSAHGGASAEYRLLYWRRQTKKARSLARSGLWYYCRQRPTLPHSFPCSTIGGIRLNFRVRNGNGCDPDPMTTGMRGAWGPPERFNSQGGRRNFPEIVPSYFKERLNILQTVV